MCKLLYYLQRSKKICENLIGNSKSNLKFLGEERSRASERRDEGVVKHKT